MKLIIKNDSKETVKNPNVKIIETTEASFTNQTVFIEENDVPIIKYTDTESMYFVKDLDNLYDIKSRSELLLNITIDNLEAIGGGNSEPVDPRPYKVYTALLTQSSADAPVAKVLENTLGELPIWTRVNRGRYRLTSPSGMFDNNKTITMITPQISDYELSVDTINYYPDEVRVLQLDRDTLTGADELDHVSFEIRVYN